MDDIKAGNKRDKWTLGITQFVNWLKSSKQNQLVEGENVTLTPQEDGTVEISAQGGDVSDVQVDGTSILDQDRVANITTMTGATSQVNGTKGLVPTPLVTDKDKFLKGDGTWGEAGGGNVDDVQMNGVSIVDANKIASFNNYVELTQAQYDALPASKLTDGVLYCIKDTGIVEGDKYAPIIYSLEEREVGVWTDGKPLYARTFTSKFINDSGTYKADISCDFSAVDKVVYSKAQFLNSTASSAIPYYAVGSDLIYYWYSKADNKIFVRATTDRTAYDVNVTLYYTKTTDVPGSGTWGTDGVPMVHYDGNERIIGTWFGETLYEKTYHYTGTLNSNTWVTIDSSRLPSNTPYFSVTNVCFISTELSSSAKFSAYKPSIPFDITISTNEQLYFENKSNYKIYEFAVTIQYTKTT